MERSKFAVYPSVEEVWSWTTRAPIQDTRVVILGKQRYIVGIRVVNKVRLGYIQNTRLVILIEPGITLGHKGRHPWRGCDTYKAQR